MQCHACGASVASASGERIGFRAVCDGCQRDLHVCLNCAHHDPAAYNGCRESSAERVADPGAANRCEYFRPGSSRAGVDGSGDALAAAEALFRKG